MRSLLFRNAGYLTYVIIALMAAFVLCPLSPVQEQRHVALRGISPLPTLTPVPCEFTTSAPTIGATETVTFSLPAYNCQPLGAVEYIVMYSSSLTHLENYDIITHGEVTHTRNIIYYQIETTSTITSELFSATFTRASTKPVAISTFAFMGSPAGGMVGVVAGRRRLFEGRVGECNNFEAFLPVVMRAGRQ
jgi:hypothetical protein